MNKKNTPSPWFKDVEDIFKPFYYSPFLSQKEDVFSEVEEKDGYYILSLDVPGVDPKNIKLKLFDQTLSISSEENYVDKNVRRKRSFNSSLTIPINVDTSKIEANVENGVMDIILPKKEAYAKSIPVQSHSSTQFLGKIKKHLQGVNQTTN